MRALNGTELLELWDEAASQAPVARAVLLLAKALPQTPVGSLAELPIGVRDRLLLDLRELTFGPSLPAVLRCPLCAVTLELRFSADDIRFADGEAGPPSIELRIDGSLISVRLPTSVDLAALAGCSDVPEGERLLVTRCIAVEDGGNPQGSSALSPAMRDAIDQALVKADPQGDVHLAATCSECGHEWLAIFDIASFFWKEISASAGCLLRDVHTLAAAYGWNERDILGMSPGRRQRYVAMALA